MTDELKKAQEDFIAKNFEDGLAVGAFKSYEQSPIFLAMKEALEFYALPWGKHHGNNETTNLIIMDTLNRAGFKAREVLEEIK